MAQIVRRRLTDQVRKFFHDGVRSRGNSYYRDGAVHIIRHDSDSVLATVQGSELYKVELRHDGKRHMLHAACNCPYAQVEDDFCKHIWATLLAADSMGNLVDAANDDKLQLELLAPEDSADEFEDDFDGDPEDDSWDESDDDSSVVPLSQPVEFIKGAIARVLGHKRAAKQARQAMPKARTAAWQNQINSVRDTIRRDQSTSAEPWPAAREVVYIIDQQETLQGRGLCVDLCRRQPKQNGEWSKPQPLKIKRSELFSIPQHNDREIVTLLQGASGLLDYSYNYSSYSSESYGPVTTRFRLNATNQMVLLPLMCRTGRCYLRPAQDGDELIALRWDEGAAWEFRLEVRKANTTKIKVYVIDGALHRGEASMPLSAPLFLIAGGMVFSREHTIARLDDAGAFAWISLLRMQGPITVPVKQGDEMVQSLLTLPRLPNIQLPEELQYEQVQLAPKPRLKIRNPTQQSDVYQPYSNLLGELTFDYGGVMVQPGDPQECIVQGDQRRVMRRDCEAERAAETLLRCLGFKDPPRYGSYDWRYHNLNTANHNAKTLALAPKKLGKVVHELTLAGWWVEAEGKILRRPGAFKLNVQSGIDWFEVHGEATFGDQTASLPELLAAIKRGDNTIRLDDGTFGMVPEDWLNQYGMLAGLGTTHDDHIRFTNTQVGLLDVMLAAKPEVSWDETFAKRRDELMRFDGVSAVDPPDSFTGQLRPYQRDGLGWLMFLQQFGLGGCLADDMGLGKTVQVLAMLEARRDSQPKAANRRKPSLVVVPKSLVFNWKQEAARFTPQLRLMDHTGVERCREISGLKGCDVVVTTYGTLRRDAALLKDVAFDIVILDEAQAIKNADTASAKAARLLQADHRLAMSGTPVENHLGELWSLFEFLNPGMLGDASALKLGSKNGGKGVDESTRHLLAKALRPFILRRTKEQVASDLPAKTEQTIFCEMETDQRRMYNELREHYRQSLLNRVERDGINKSKIQILEALLRLRQAACHPGLIDKQCTAEPCAKLDVLLPRLKEVIDEGHKALVFSQFTSLLSIVKPPLDEQKITYEYLDGKTRDRAARVERFQSDPDCRLFLISLKAGGLGLNLTAADYVFLLDPWWNPAVEAQAIDRAHRIGQTRQVFAYRLIARDTVEEKVLELQQSKRELADSIIRADENLIRTLGREDLELLLS